MEKADIEKINDFFRNDINVKNILFNMAPKEEYNYKDGMIEYGMIGYEMIKYVDKLHKELEELHDCITDMALFACPRAIQYIEKLFKMYESELNACNYDYIKITLFYQKCLSNIDDKLINQIEENCYGYGGEGVNITSAKTVNELLHVMHMNVVNSEAYYQSFPASEEKENNAGYTIFLRGENNQNAKKIYDHYPLDMNCGWTDILGLPSGKVLIMVLDRGHALTIEVDKVQDKYIVSYFIPKICNVEMVNKLNGVHKVNSSSRCTSGSFQTDEANLPVDVINLINGVPMDKDIILNASFYHRK